MVTWLVLLMLAGFAAQNTAPNATPTDASFDFTRTMRVDYFHTGGPDIGRDVRARSRRQRRPVARQPHAVSSTRPTSASTSSRSSTASGRSALLARLRVGLRRVGDDRRGQDDASRRFHESLRFPGRRSRCSVTLKKRQPDNRFSRSGRPTSIRRRDSSTPRACARTPGRSGRLRTRPGGGESRPAGDRRGLHRARAAEVPQGRRAPVDALFAEEPFKSRKRDFNVRALDLPSAESGVHRPNAGVFRRTLLSAEYNIFDSERYVLTLDNRALRDAASSAPYEFLEILVNEKHLRRRRHLQRPGDGRRSTARLRSTCSSTSSAITSRRWPTSTTRPMSRTRPARRSEQPEPWEPNVTALADPATLKWRDLVAPGTPLPTPWDKEEFERHSRAIQERAAGDPQAQRARGGDGRALSRTAGTWKRNSSAG